MNRLQAHQTHQTLDSFTVDLFPLTGQPGRHSAATIDRCLEILLVDPPHQSQVAVDICQSEVEGLCSPESGHVLLGDFGGAEGATVSQRSRWSLILATRRASSTRKPMALVQWSHPIARA